MGESPECAQATRKHIAEQQGCPKCKPDDGTYNAGALIEAVIDIQNQVQLYLVGRK